MLFLYKNKIFVKQYNEIKMKDEIYEIWGTNKKFKTLWIM